MASGVSSISLRNVSRFLSAISPKKNKWSKHFKLIDLRAGNRSSSCANLPSSPECSVLQWSSRHAYTFSRIRSISCLVRSPRISEKNITKLNQLNLNPQKKSPKPGLNRMTAFRQDSSALSMFIRFILTLSSDRIRSKIGATPACWALFRWMVKFGPRHISWGVLTGDLRSIVLSGRMCSVSKYWRTEESTLEGEEIRDC